MAELRIFSYGGGVQSNAVMVLQATGQLPTPYDAFVFANVGADSENPATLRYIEDVARPFMESHELRFVEVQKAGESLRDVILSDRKSVVVPAHTMDAKGKIRRLHRNCTDDFKIKVIDAYIAGLPTVTHAQVGLGISLDEIERMKDTDWHDRYGDRPIGYWKQREYPLIDLRLRRSDCEALIARAGLPVPPKSSCFYCPFKTAHEWIELRKTDPALFAQAVEIDQRVTSKDTSVRGRAFLHRSATPLLAAVGSQVSMEDYADACEDGYCMT